MHKCINLSHRNTSSYMLVIKYKATRKRVALTDTRIYARALEDTVLEDAIQQAANRFYLADTMLRTMNRAVMSIFPER